MIKLSKVLSITLIILFALSLLAFCSGMRVNYTQSYPIGLYFVSAKQPNVGSLVNFCPPNTEPIQFAFKHKLIVKGFCDGGYGQLMKAIVATEGDSISTSQNGVVVNGKLLKNSAPLRVEGLSIYKTEQYTLAKDEVLLMSTYNPTSFDGRYFGVISSSYITEVIKPLFTLTDSPNIQFVQQKEVAL